MGKLSFKLITTFKIHIFTLGLHGHQGNYFTIFLRLLNIVCIKYCVVYIQYVCLCVFNKKLKSNSSLTK